MTDGALCGGRANGVNPLGNYAAAGWNLPLQCCRKLYPLILSGLPGSIQCPGLIVVVNVVVVLVVVVEHCFWRLGLGSVMHSGKTMCWQWKRLSRLTSMT